jgi:hypothetical protein
MIMSKPGCTVAASHRRRSALVGVIAILLQAGAPAQASPAEFELAGSQYPGFITEAAQRFDIPEGWIRAVMQAESAGDARAVSPAGAMGLMQIMPGTWSTLQARYGVGADPFDAHDNILAGAAYLRELHDRYGAPGFLAAYNAGPARYDEYLATGRPLPSETVGYLTTIERLLGPGALGDVSVAAPTARPWTEAPLFAGQASGGISAVKQPFPLSGQAAGGLIADGVAAPKPPRAGLFVQIGSTSGRVP